MATLAFWILFLSFLGAFAAQVGRRVQLIAAAPQTFSLDNLGFRTTRFVVDVAQTRERLRRKQAKAA